MTTADDVSAHVREKLSDFEVHYVADDAAPCAFACGLSTAIGVSHAEEALVREVAEYTERTRRLLRYKKGRISVVLALAPRTKRVYFDRPLTMDDVNSGVTFPKEAQIIMFRWDADFWKVLQHELIAQTHLCNDRVKLLRDHCQGRGSGRRVDKI